MNNGYNPFNSLMQEYLCERLSNLTSEQLRLLNESERSQIYKKSKIINFVKKKNPFQVLSILTKINLNWGIYIIDESFDIDEFKDLVEDKGFAGNIKAIRNALQKNKSFITNSKFFAHLQNMIVNAYHGLDVIWNRRFIKISDKVRTKVKDEFDNYSILSPEVEFKGASDGASLMLDIFRNIPHISDYCKQRGLTFTDFILLCEMYYKSENWYGTAEVDNIMNPKYSKRIKFLYNAGYLHGFQNKYNINTKGILFVGEVMSTLLDRVYLD